MGMMPPRMAVIVVVTSGAAEPPSLTFDAPRVVIGRGEGCDVRLPDPSVSQRHASIRQRGTDYLVFDEGSTNGTFVGPVRLPPGAPRVLRTGDRIRVGRVWLELRVEPIPVTQSSALATRELALRLVAEGLARQGEPAAVRVRVTAGPSSGAYVELVEADRPYAVGRGKGVDLALDDADLSRRHLQITRRADRILLRDLGSKNGSRVEDVPVPSDADLPWSKGKPLTVGVHVLEYDDPVRAALEELERTPDEKLGRDEIIDEPRPEPDAEEAPAGASPGEAAAAPRAAESRRPAPSRRARADSRPSGWTGTDYLVAAAALFVLAVSVLGLVWLIRSG